jgi:hypothetical protein
VASGILTTRPDRHDGDHKCLHKPVNKLKSWYVQATRADPPSGREEAFSFRNATFAH